jgi:membrane-associated protease RseP (regulator of RpoE activity)
MDTIFSSTPRIFRSDNDEDGVRVFPNGNWPDSIRGGDGPLVWTLGANRRIGVSTQSLTKQLADYFGVSGGVLITSVSDNSPASKAGLKAGDVITAIDGEKVTSPGDISRTLGKKETGDVSLTVVRDRNTRTITVTPEKNPNQDLFKPGSLGARRIVVPSVKVRSIPPMKIEIPQIDFPATPPIEVTVPRGTPRVIRSRSVII